MTDPISFPYKPKISMLAFGTLFMGGFSYALVQTAMDPSSHQLFIFLAASAVFIGALALLGFIEVIVSLIKKNEALVLTETEISLPCGLFRTERKIPLDEIENLTFCRVKNEIYLEFIHQGKKISVFQSRLPEGAFDQISDILMKRVIPSSH